MEIACSRQAATKDGQRKCQKLQFHQRPLEAAPKANESIEPRFKTPALTAERKKQNKNKNSCALYS